ncbi:MAG: hypothetical protein F6J93_30145 [Oscillatoria sp. SIO1A7]|nr:hypothetical protein [Oscillatoria sp. SIO1A7]
MSRVALSFHSQSKALSRSGRSRGTRSGECGECGECGENFSGSSQFPMPNAQFPNAQCPILNSQFPMILFANYIC